MRRSTPNVFKRLSANEDTDSLLEHNPTFKKQIKHQLNDQTS